MKDEVCLLPPACLEQILSPGEMETFQYVNYHRYAPGEIHEDHSHDDRDELFICTGGSGLVTGDRERRIGEGEVIIVPSGEVHGFVSDQHRPLEYIYIACKLPGER